MTQRSSWPNIGLVFSRAASRSSSTVVHTDRPLDIAPTAGTEFTVSFLADEVQRLAGCLHAVGLREGDRLAIVKDNHLDVFLLAAAAARLGGLPVLLSAANSAEVLGILIGRIRPRAIVADSAAVARLTAAGDVLAGYDTTVIVVGAAAPGLPAGVLLLDEIRGSESPPVRIAASDAPMIVTHTSGTTGVPKLVVHSATTALRRVPPRMERFPLPLVTARPKDTVAGALPFTHIRSVIWMTSQITIGPRALIAISDPSPDNVQRLFGQQRPTCLEAMPNVFLLWEELVDRDPGLFAQVRLFLSTFDAIHPRTVSKFIGVSKARFPVWTTALAQSESHSSIGSFITRGMVRKRDGLDPGQLASGWPTFVRVKVVDPVTGRKVAKGQRGLLKVSTKARCLTYLGEEDRFQAKVDGKWWNTGDIAENLGFGRIRMLDREVDMVPGISCIQLEGILLDRLPEASEVIVLSVPGGPPVPVVCTDDNNLDEARWRRAVGGLPELAEPRTVPWDEMPRTGTGKIRRSQLRENLLGAKKGAGTGAWT